MWLCPPIYNTGISILISLREVREFANGSVCLECDSQCEKTDGSTVTCLGQVRRSLIHDFLYKKQCFPPVDFSYFTSFFLSYLKHTKVGPQFTWWDCVGLTHRRFQKTYRLVFAKVKARLMD